MYPTRKQPCPRPPSPYIRRVYFVLTSAIHDSGLVQTDEKLLVKLQSLLSNLELELEFCGFFEQDSKFGLQRMGCLREICQARFRFPPATPGQLHGLLTTRNHFATPFLVKPASARARRR